MAETVPTHAATVTRQAVARVHSLLAASAQQRIAVHRTKYINAATTTFRTRLLCPTPRFASHTERLVIFTRTGLPTATVAAMG